MNCKECGEQMEGDGYRTVLHCPNATDIEIDYLEPDAAPAYCEGAVEDE